MKKDKEDNGRKASKTKAKSKPFFTDERIKFIIGILLSGIAVYLLLACVSYLFWWKTDLSLADSQVVSNADVNVRNWSGKSGHFLAKMIVGFGFGFGAFFIPAIIGAIGLYLLKFPKINLWKLIVKFTFAAIILSLLLGFIFGKADGYLGSGPGGAQGFKITEWLNSFAGKVGTGIILTLLTVGYLIFALRFKPETFTKTIPATIKSVIPGIKTDNIPVEPSDDSSETEVTSGEKVKVIEREDEDEEDEEVEFVVKRPTGEDYEGDTNRGSIIHVIGKDEPEKKIPGGVPININKPEATDILPDHEVEKLMENYDPRLDLSRYKFPPISILTDHKSDLEFDDSEVIENKENIIKTLGDHNITITHISATVGPTVTLYEIVPDRGIR
ncbi:MAG: DNA translocase FtsK 4TM domain-containing protein, partial [Bacteroidia bacterium]|nr:DNA translocase FtsK 4TM domain-containing protein [Bacteroidia bacterium]